jgi:hypothetical protein
VITESFFGGVQSAGGRTCVSTRGRSTSARRAGVVPSANTEYEGHSANNAGGHQYAFMEE